MPVLSIRQLLQEISSTPAMAVIHGQCADISQRQTKNGKTYYQLRLQDSRAAIDIKIWENSRAFPFCQEAFASGAKPFVELQANWKSTDFGPEADVQVVRVLDGEQKAALLTGAAEVVAAQKAARQTIERLILTIADPRLSALCRFFLSRYGHKFAQCAAARTFHHARRGGLSEHVAGMMSMAEMACQVYPELNRDLMLAGAFFHDVGKLWENSPAEDGFAIEFDQMGELLGHIPLGILFIQHLWNQVMAQPQAEQWKTLQPESEQVRRHLLHLIAAHHGELEFGSPVVPKTPEAAALHYIDNLDAKIEMFRLAYAESSPLGDQILSRRAPLPGNVVLPLPKFTGE